MTPCQWIKNPYGLFRWKCKTRSASSAQTRCIFLTAFRWGLLIFTSELRQLDVRENIFFLNDQQDNLIVYLVKKEFKQGYLQKLFLKNYLESFIIPLSIYFWISGITNSLKTCGVYSITGASLFKTISFVALNFFQAVSYTHLTLPTNSLV